MRHTLPDEVRARLTDDALIAAHLLLSLIHI